MKEWYETHERRLSTASLVFGFAFDALTLSRIDSTRDNLWMAANLLIVAIVIVLLNKQENASSSKRGESWRHFWLFNILQFGFGAVLGSFFIFYFQSGTLAVSWPFLLILFAAIVANELFQKRYTQLAFQLSFFYLALFSYAIFLLPIFLHRIGASIFVLSGLVSLAGIYLFILILKRLTREKFRQNRILVIRSITGIFIVFNILYFTNLIPPIPLSLKEAGVYHLVERDGSGSYVVAGERKGFLSYFHFRETVHLVSGDILYAYSAIFSPASLDTRIIHEWQYRDEETGEWRTATRIPLVLSGGRAEGYRTYSVKSNLAAGDWRVNVETPRGQLMGRINFRIIDAEKRPTLFYRVK